MVPQSLLPLLQYGFPSLSAPVGIVSSFSTGRRVFRIGLLASTIAAFLPTHVNSYASLPSTTSGESICFSSSKLTARLYTFFSGVLCSSSSISVTQFGNRAAMRSMFCAVISGDSNFILSIMSSLPFCYISLSSNSQRPNMREAYILHLPQEHL